MPDFVVSTGATTGSTNTTLGIDSNHPYFLTNSYAPSMTLNKLDFITWDQSAPAVGSSDLQLWSRCNDMVTSWLLNSLSREIADSVIYSRSARELCLILEHRFGQSNGAKLFHLQKELSRLVQGNNNIAGYFTNLKRL
ncbi:hypothetical protein KY284_027117 [Solanum tuberosum]|nr:hypothetical protein KY284_027117 [Solanum tuberosum]